MVNRQSSSESLEAALTEECLILAEKPQQQVLPECDLRSSSKTSDNCLIVRML